MGGEAGRTPAVILVGADPVTVGEAVDAHRRRGQRVGVFVGNAADRGVMEAAEAMASEYFGPGTAVEEAAAGREE